MTEREREIILDTMKGVKEGTVPLDTAEVVQDLGYTQAALLNAEDRTARRIGEGKIMADLAEGHEKIKKLK